MCLTNRLVNQYGVLLIKIQAMSEDKPRPRKKTKMTNDSKFQFDRTDTSADNSEQSTFLSRRRLMKGTAGVAGAGALAGLGLWYGTRPALAAQTFQETDGEVVVTTNAGEVMDVRVAPVFDLSWQDFGGGASSFGFDITAAVAGSSNTVYSTTGVSSTADNLVDGFDLGSSSLSGYSGSVIVTCAPQSIIDGTNITTGSFPTGVSEGATQSETVTLGLTPSGQTNLGGSVTGTESTISFDVTVDNPDGTVTVSITSSNAEADGAESATETPVA